MEEEDATGMGEADGVVDFEVDASLAAAQEAVDDERVLICVVYDDEHFWTRYVDEPVDELYPDENERRKHFGQIYLYIHVDFTEREVFQELFLEPDGSQAFVTYMGNLIAVRVVTQTEGLFVALAPGSPLTDLVDAAEDLRRV